MSDVQEISVELGARRYPIRIGHGLIAQSDRWRDAIRGRHVLLISDENVAPLYAARVLEAFDGFAASKIEFPAGELSKSFEACEAVFDTLAEMGASRGHAPEKIEEPVLCRSLQEQAPLARSVVRA